MGLDAVGGRRQVGYAAVATELARLTARDRWLLELLAEHRVFTTEQIQALGYQSRQRALGRLGQLYHRDILDRFRHYHRPGSQSWRWTLGPAGAAILAAAADRPLPRPAAIRQDTARLAASPHLAHRLGANGFFTALITARRYPAEETGLLRWLGETRAAHETGGLVRPDGYGRWRDAGRAVEFWLEWDTGTETLDRLVTKIATGYAQLAGTPKAHPVLFWFSSATREEHFHQRLHADARATTGLAVATAYTPPESGGPEHGAAQGVGDPAGPAWRLWPQPANAPRTRLSALPSVLSQV